MRRRKQDWSPRETQGREQRYDLFAVKVYDGKWVVVGIFERREDAVNLIRTISRDHRRNFPLIQPNLVHPSKQLVAAWTAYGNRIS